MVLTELIVSNVANSKRAQFSLQNRNGTRFINGYGISSVLSK